MREPYPPIEPYDSGHLRVSELHQIYYEQSGNPRGIPALFVHAGPGMGTSPFDRRLFDPSAYRVVLFDQRGAGRSRPRGELRENTTWHLVEDMEKLRDKLGIRRWLLLGGSWGSTLALAYAERHPRRVTGLILRGIFLLRAQELAWLYESGASRIFPDRWAELVEPIPQAERADLLGAYHRRLSGEATDEARRAARAWCAWEASLSKLLPSDRLADRFAEPDFAWATARIECHYFVHRGFFDPADQLLRNVAAVRPIPAVIVQGRYDMVCPVETAFELHRAWPEAEFHLVAGAGHSAGEPSIQDRLIQATDGFCRG